MSSSVSILESELERARERLKGTEDSIKKNIGRGIISPPNRGGFKRRISDIGQAADVGPKEPQRPRLSFEGFGRGQGRLGPPVNSKFGARNQAKPEERISAKKRLGEQGAVTVFSRLSGPPKDDEYERTEPVRQEVKLTSQVVTTQDAPSRKEVLAAQSGDNQCRARNRRMFGALLGTLQKFRQEENQLKEKEQKRAQVEKKLEEAALKEKEELKKKRQELFSNRRQQQFEIKKLEFKLLRLKQLSEWEATRKHLLNFIQTKSSPKIFWLPKIHTDKTKKLQDETKASITKMIQEKRAEVEKSIDDHNDQKRDANETMDDSLDKTDDFDKSMEMNPTDENANADVLEKSADIPSPAVQEVDEPRIDDDQSQDGDAADAEAADAEAMETSMAESEAAEVEEESLNGRLSDIEPPPPQS